MARITRAELTGSGQIPRYLWFGAPRHYSASLGSDADNFLRLATNNFPVPGFPNDRVVLELVFASGLGFVGEHVFGQRTERASDPERHFGRGRVLAALEF